MAETNKRARWTVPLICAFLAVAVFSVDLPSAWFGFTNYDDPDYVTKNYMVQRGVTWEGITWAFGGAHAANWHPLTWLSHMLDFQAYGMWAGGHHLTNVILHAANTVLLFLALLEFIGCSSARLQLACAMVAVLFGLHPMHVESVAWVAERKDVLSGFFFMLTLLAYGRYVRLNRGALACRLRSGAHYGDQVELAPAFERAESRRGGVVHSLKLLCASRAYWLCLLAFACGLMSKPMLVTVPAVLLILDFWPSRRFEREQARDLIFEKVPFVVLSAATCFITLWAQKNAMAPMQQGSLWARVCNAIVCYVLYLKKLCWPSKLAVLYPEVQGWTAGVVIVCFGLLSVAAVVCAWQWRRRPWAACGFAWFLIMLIPVIGLVKVGAHLIADRYTYLPSIGLFIAVVFAAAEALPAVPGIFAAGCAFLLCALLACHQLYFWQNSFTLFRHTVAVTRNNYIALASLAYDYAQYKEVRQAHQCLKESLEIDPNFDLAWKQLSGVLKDENKLVEAAAAARRSIGINGKSFGAYASLGQIEMESGKTNEAMANYAIALKLKPDYADGHYNLANALARAGDFRGAGEHFAKAAEYDPASPDAHNNYGYVLMREGNYSAAEREFRETIRLRPASWKSHYGLAEVLRHGGDAGRAIAELEETVREKPDFAPARKMLQELRGGR